MRRFFLLYVFCYIVFACASGDSNKGPHSYLYPVGTVEHEGAPLELVLWQTSSSTTELYLWNAQTGNAYKELFGLYTPAGIQVLPSKKAYSFIDNGRVRVKELIKRSPATLCFSRPIYNASVINWINDDIAYCFAQEGHRIGIYLFNREGIVKRVLYDGLRDYLFPSYLENRLFYVRRDFFNGTAHHTLCMIPLEPKDLQIPDNGHEYGIDTTQNQKIIIEVGEESLAFLRMERLDRGFVVMHPRSLDATHKTLQLHYGMIEKNNNQWSLRTLFTFDIPMFLLDSQGTDRLYENILPLLPYHEGDKIYYASAQASSGGMQTYCFDLLLGIKRQCHTVENRGPLLLSPRRCNGKLVCGGILAQGLCNFMPEASIKCDGETAFRLLDIN